MLNTLALLRRGALVVTAVLCTAVLCVAVMRTSMARGRLAFDPQWDDVMYMARGAELARAGREGWTRGGAVGLVRAVAHDWKVEPPHSPWNSGGAAIGYGVFGYEDWAAYVATFLPVLTLLVCAARLARRAGGRYGWRSHALVIFAATAPFLAASVYNLKPDYAAGICAAIGMMKSLRGPVLGGGRAPWRRLVWIGAWFGLALLAKPRMMVPTGMLVGGTLAICTVRDLVLRWVQHARFASVPVEVWRAGRTWGIVLGVMGIVAAPHFALAWRMELEYTRKTLTGEGIERWGYHGSWMQHGTYYLTGPGGHLMLDGVRSLAPLGVALLMYGWIALVRPSRGVSRRGVYFAAVVCALGMAWIGPTLSTVKIAQYASCFSALLWLAGVHAAAGVCAAACSGERGWLRGPLAASLLVAAMLGGSLAAFRWTIPLVPADRGAPARTAREARDELVHRAYETVKAECAGGGGAAGSTGMGGRRSIAVAGGQLDLGYLLTLWCIRDGLALDVRMLGGEWETSENAEAEAERMGRASFGGCDLVLVSRGVAKSNKPRVIRADEFYFGLAGSDRRFEMVARTVDPATGAVFELYRRRVGG